MDSAVATKVSITSYFPRNMFALLRGVGGDFSTCRRVLEAWNLASSLSDKVPRDFVSVLKKAHNIAAFRYGPSASYLGMNVESSQGCASGSNPPNVSPRGFLESFLDRGLVSTAQREPPLVLKKNASMSGHRDSSFIRERFVKDCRTRSYSNLVRAADVSACLATHSSVW